MTRPLGLVIPRTISGGGGGFAPTDLSGLRLWADFPDTTGFSLSGSTVTSYTEKALGKTFTIGGSPTRTATLNGLTGVEFNGTNQYFNCTNYPLNNASDGSMSVFAVVTPTGSLTERSIVDGDDSPHMGQRIAQYLRFDSGQLQSILFDSGGSNTSMQGGSISAGTSYMCSMTCGGTDGTLYLNGVSVGSLTQGSQGYNASNTCTLGGQEGGTRQYFPGKMYEIIAYNRKLNSTELGQVHTYLDTRYNL